MYFNSVSFFIFLISVFLFYWFAVRKSQKTGNAILLAASYIFYGWWDWRFLILIIISSTTDYLIGKQLFKQALETKRKQLLFISIFINIGMLFFFKYFNFFIDSFETLLGFSSNQNQWNALNIILPVGISFYTFQTLSYTIDIYNRKTAPTTSVLTFFTFVAFFPQLVAGPIERAKRLIPQFEKKSKFSYDQATSGLKLILYGLFKKMVIADQLATLVNAVYSSPQNFGSFELILATLFFGFQIYCDFSGYSDIAIGTARLFGIELMINFRTPYFASSISDFWHRWHISLSTWFRDYIYIPLGGNRGNSFQWTRNILITFIISGLWHGANFTFLIWGGIHGILYVLEKFISPVLKFSKKLKTFLGLGFTFIVVNLSWIFFRAETWEKAKFIFKKIVFFNSESIANLWELLRNAEGFTEAGRMLFYIFPLFILVEILIKEETFAELFCHTKRIYRWSIYFVLVVIILFFGVLNAAPEFIYFQF